MGKGTEKEVMRAALYARYSTDKQSESSIDSQFRQCERLAEREGFTVVARFRDEAISGGTAQRPEYQAMLAAARRHEFDVIVADEVSRLWRNTAEQAPRIAELRDRRLHVVTRDLDTRQESSRLTGPLMGVMAEEYRRKIGPATYRGQEQRAIEGKSTGGRAYGYRSEPVIVEGRVSHSIVHVDEEQAVVVRRIFELYADGKSPRGIADLLNAEGVPSPGAKWRRTTRRKDGKWLASAIHGDQKRGTGILNNRRYLGVVTWGASKWDRGEVDSAKRNQRRLERAAVERRDERLRIVPNELWGRVKERQKRRTREAGERVKIALGRRRPGGGRHGKYLLSGLLKCGKCRASWVLSNGARYQCASHHEGGKAACDVSLSLRRDLAERIILDCVETDLLDPAKLSALEARLRAVVSRPAPNYDKRIAELTREIENLADAIAKVGLSEALAERLKVAERERSHMIAAQGAGRSEPRALPQATIEHRVAIMRQRLAGGGEAARQALREIFPQALVITIDGGRLFAEFPELVMMPDGELVGVRAALFDGYLTQPGEFEDVRPEVENSGSGGRI